MLRLIAVFLFLVVFLLLGSLIQLAEYLIGKKNPELRDRSSLAIVNWAFRVILFLCGTKLTIIGLEKVPEDQAVLYIGNHHSFFDIVTTYPQVKGRTGYIAKKETEKVPFLNIWMRLLYCLFLDRQDIRQGAKIILAAIDHIKNGISIFVFPEGTRNKGDVEMLPFHGGTFKIAEKSGCPIIPVSINNSSAIFEDHFPWIKKAHVVIEYGDPILTAEMSREEKKNLSNITYDRILEMYRKNKELSRQL